MQDKTEPMFKPVEVIPVRNAVICNQCNCITSMQTDGRCIVCGSDSPLPLYRILGEV